MLETPHVIVGAAIATKVANPFLALPLAFGSHFILEKVPHWNPHLNTEKKKFGKITTQSTQIIVLDVICALISGFFIASKSLPDSGRFAIILLASFLSVLPDLIEGPYFFMNVKSKFLEKWIAFQKSLQSDASPLPGLTTQVLTIFAAFWWILN